MIYWTTASERRKCILLFHCWIILQGTAAQKTFPSKVSYTAKRLYEMKLDMKPISVRLVHDRRFSSKVIPVFDMIIMSYLPRSEIRRIPDLTAKINIPQQMALQQTVTDHSSLTMPNAVGILPDNTIDKQPQYVWWIATGSFGPSSGFPNSEGGIHLLDMSQTKWKPTSIYSLNHNGFSHVEWLDMDRDNWVDCITVRGTLNRASLMWLAQPREDKGMWEPHPISNSSVDLGGTDFKLMHVRLQKGFGTRMLIVVAGRRTATLTAYWVDDSDNDWTQTSNIRSTIIAQGEAYVNVEIADLNGDGYEEILTSVAAFAGRPGRLLAFEVPKAGFGVGEWRKRILNEWPPSAATYRTLTPGPAYPFYFATRDIQSSRKPHILVSGADDGKVYVLSPDSWSPYMWKYTVEEIYSSKAPIGIPAISDVEGDGNVEIFIPSGESIIVMRYQPSKGSIRSTPSYQHTCSLLFLSIFLFSFTWQIR